MKDVQKQIQEAKEQLEGFLGGKGRPTRGRIEYNAGPYKETEAVYIDFLYYPPGGGYEIWSVPVGPGQPFRSDT